MFLDLSLRFRNRGFVQQFSFFRLHSPTQSTPVLDFVEMKFLQMVERLCSFYSFTHQIPFVSYVGLAPSNVIFTIVRPSVRDTVHFKKRFFSPFQNVSCFGREEIIQWIYTIVQYTYLTVQSPHPTPIVNIYAFALTALIKQKDHVNLRSHAFIIILFPKKYNYTSFYLENFFLQLPFNNQSSAISVLNTQNLTSFPVCSGLGL